MIVDFWGNIIIENPSKPPNLKQKTNSRNKPNTAQLLPIFDNRTSYHRLIKLHPRHIRNLTLALNRTLPFNEQYSTYEISNAAPNELINTLLEHVNWLNTANIKKHATTTPGVNLQFNPQGFSTQLNRLNQNQLRSLASFIGVNNSISKHENTKARWGKLKLLQAIDENLQHHPQYHLLEKLCQFDDNQIQQIATMLGCQELNREQIIEHILVECA